MLWAGTRRWWLAAAVGAALSIVIELTQALALPDRYPDVRDLIANTLGAAVGAAAVASIAVLAAPARRDRRPAAR